MRRAVPVRSPASAGEAASPTRGQRRPGPEICQQGDDGTDGWSAEPKCKQCQRRGSLRRQQSARRFSKSAPRPPRCRAHACTRHAAQPMASVRRGDCLGTDYSFMDRMGRTANSAGQSPRGGPAEYEDRTAETFENIHQQSDAAARSVITRHATYWRLGTVMGTRHTAAR